MPRAPSLVFAGFAAFTDGRDGDAERHGRAGHNPRAAFASSPPRTAAARQAQIRFEAGRLSPAATDPAGRVAAPPARVPVSWRVLMMTRRLTWRPTAPRSRPAAQRARPGCSTRLARAGRRGRRGPVGKGTPAVPSPPPSSPTPPVVLLSEATVALDPENEQTVRPALPALTASRMLLVIARRFQTVMAADQIRSWWSRKAASPGTAPTTSASASAGGTPPSVRAGPRPQPAAEQRARPRRGVHPPEPGFRRRGLAARGREVSRLDR